jgi:hypothetical protein
MSSRRSTEFFQYFSFTLRSGCHACLFVRTLRSFSILMDYLVEIRWRISGSLVCYSVYLDVPIEPDSPKVV